MISDTDLLNAIERLNWEIEAPDGENMTWVVYSPGESLGAGLGCSRSLREALGIAYRKTHPKDSS